MKVGDFCNREVIVIEEDRSISEAAEVMREHHVGDVVVVRPRSGKNIPLGILTDRDIALSIVAYGINPESACVGDAMSFDLVVVAEEDDLLQVIEIMREEGIRRIPVIDKGEALVGILAVDDVLKLINLMLSKLVNLVDEQKQRESKFEF